MTEKVVVAKQSVKQSPIEPSPSPVAGPDGWVTLGPGPGKDEVLRCQPFPSGFGWIIATVVMRRGYSTKLTASGDNEVIDRDAITRSMVFSPISPMPISPTPTTEAAVVVPSTPEPKTP